MKDVNYPLRKAYFAALKTITYNSSPVPVYYQYLPDDINPDVYILFGGISNTDASTNNSFDTSTLMQVTVGTFKEKYNDGKAADEVGGKVLEKIYTKPSTLSATGIKIVSTTLQSDLIQDWSLQNQRVYIDRLITFKHYIYLN